MLKVYGLVTSLLPDRLDARALRRRRFLRSGVALTALTLSAAMLIPAAAYSEEHHETESSTMPESKNQTVRLTDKGIEPAQLTMKREDSIVFFLNDSSDALATIAIDFKDHTTHCATTNLKIGEHGVISSTKPMQPKEFASVCFHDAGSYPVTVYGLKQHPQGLSGTINVE